MKKKDTTEWLEQLNEERNKRESRELNGKGGKR